MTTEAIETPPRQQIFLLVVFMYLFRALVGAHALSMWLILILRATVGERWTIIAAVNESIHLGVLPALVLLPLCLLLRRWGLALLFVPVVLVCFSWYGPYFLPAAAPTPLAEDETSLTVLTYNIAGLNSAGRDWSQIETVIRAADADIVALQELSPSAAEYLAAALADDYPAQVLYPRVGASGGGVLSRYPILDETQWQLTFVYQRLEVDINNQVIVLYNVHPPPPQFSFAVRDAEIIDLLNRAEAEAPGTPVLIIGDFNTTDKSEIYSRIHESYNDAWGTVGRGVGWTFGAAFLDLPLARIDYVWHSAAFRALAAHPMDTFGGSDHRAVWAQLALAAPDQEP